MYTRLPVWAPSPVADPLFREVPKAVDEAEIAEIVAGYAVVAEHCAEGGFDGIELQCSHSSIVRGFLSPATNRRTDGYGGRLENRARLLLEIVAAVREAIGRGLALGVRLCGDELIEGGTTIDEAVEVAQAGRGHRPGRLHQHLDRRGDGHPVHDRGVDARPARATRCSSRRRSARRSTCRSSASAGSRTRCRPSGRWPRATATSSASCGARSPTPTSRPRPAPAPPTRSGCACRATRSASGAWASTAGSAASRTRAPAGRPTVPAGAAPAPHGRRSDVVVVGAGPAGLQAAIAAARNGHRVTVLRAGRRGRAARCAWRPRVPNRAELGDLVRNQLAECRRLGVDHRVRRRRVAAGWSTSGGPTTSIVATGAEPARPVVGAAPTPAQRVPTSATCSTARRGSPFGEPSS